MFFCSLVIETESEAANGQQTEGGDAAGGSLCLPRRTHAAFTAFADQY